MSRVMLYYLGMPGVPESRFGHLHTPRCQVSRSRGHAHPTLRLSGSYPGYILPLGPSGHVVNASVGRERFSIFTMVIAATFPLSKKKDLDLELVVLFTYSTKSYAHQVNPPCLRVYVCEYLCVCVCVCT